MRDAARVLVIDGAQRILLLEFAEASGGSCWAAPGGGLEPGETHEQAAIRECREETGLSEIALGPCVWVREHVYEIRGVLTAQRERFFVAHTPPFDVAEGVRRRHAAEGIRDCRWWTLAELAAASVQFAPRRLAELLARLLEGGVPTEPFDVGV